MREGCEEQFFKASKIFKTNKRSKVGHLIINQSIKISFLSFVKKVSHVETYNEPAAINRHAFETLGRISSHVKHFAYKKKVSKAKHAH